MATPADILEAERRWVQERHIDLVCEGGGVLGIGLVGAYSVLQERGFKVQNLAGTSAGAIVAALIAAGYDAAALKTIISNLDFSHLLDPVAEEDVPLVGKTLPARLLALLKHHGEYRGDAFEHTVAGYLANRGIRTFKDLIADAGLLPTSVYRYKVQVIASDVTGRRLLRLPMDAGQIGVDPDDLPVAKALRMSMSIPFFFTPVTCHDPVTREDHTVVDGGMLSNFPVWIFDVGGDAIPPWPTFGVKLVASTQTQEIGAGLAPAPITDTIGYIKALVDTMVTFHDRLYLDTHTAARTIAVPTGTISSTNFNLSGADKEQLFQSGREAAARFLGDDPTKPWPFAGYIAAFRTPTPRPQRQDLIRQAMEQAAAALAAR